MVHYLSWLCDDLLPAFDTFSFRHPAGRWQMAASVLATLLSVLTVRAVRLHKRLTGLRFPASATLESVLTSARARCPLSSAVRARDL